MALASSFATAPQKLPSIFTTGANLVRNFFSHRDLLWQMVGNDLRGRYVGSALGLFWSVIHPLLQIVIYTVVFSQVMRAQLGELSSPYAFSIYLCAGLLPWMTCAEMITRCTGIFWEHANLVKKIAFPKVLLYAYVAVAAAANLAVMMFVFAAVLWAIDAMPPLTALLLWVPLLLLQLTFALGIGLVTSVLNVFFRDVAQITAVMLQLWFWLTPIVYVPTVLPPSAAALVEYNLMAHFTRIHQRLLVSGETPDPATWVFLAAVASCSLVIGVCCFLSLRRRIPDEL
jgi:lipopolysaccharide transport system permease protein